MLEKIEGVIIGFTILSVFLMLFRRPSVKAFTNELGLTPADEFREAIINSKNAKSADGDLAAALAKQLRASIEKNAKLSSKVTQLTLAQAKTHAALGVALNLSKQCEHSPNLSVLFIALDSVNRGDLSDEVMDPIWKYTERF